MSLCRLAGLLAVLFVLCSCAGSNRDSEAIYNRLSNHENLIRDLSSQLNMSGDGVVPGQAEMWAQIQTLRQDINQLSGQLGEWAQQNAEGETFAQLRARVNRIESAVRKMGSVLAIELNELDTLSAYATGQSSLGQDAYGGGLSGGSVGLPSAVAQGPGLAGSNLAAAPGDAAGAEALAAASNSPSVSDPVAAQPLERGADMAATLYNSGTKAFSDRKYQDAVKIFQDFVSNYPKNKLTSNAYFWLGESYYQLKNYNGAILAYQQIIEKFSGSNKVQPAMFKQGVSMYQKGQQDAGKIRLNELIAKYPKSPEADRARQFLKNNR
jgi:tol-pal system protein YbgF